LKMTAAPASVPISLTAALTGAAAPGSVQK
jgi:hypothetical protein